MRVSFNFFDFLLSTDFLKVLFLSSLFLPDIFWTVCTDYNSYFFKVLGFSFRCEGSPIPHSIDYRGAEDGQVLVKEHIPTLTQSYHLAHWSKLLI